MRPPRALAPWLAALAAGCGADERLRGRAPECRAARPLAAPACGSPVATPPALVAASGAAGWDEALAAKAERHDRVFHAIAAHSTGVNTEVTLSDPSERALLDAFARDDDGWDFEAFAGQPPGELAIAWHKVAGAYAGAGIAADAFRYAVLRDEGASCERVDQARAALGRDLGALHLATAITGVPGVVARGFQRTDVPGDGETQETTPLFDASGQPLPPEKNNGTWRADASGGSYAEYIWEDSCSRDMLAGWALGFAAAWEAVRDDPTFAREDKARLRADAAAILASLRQVGERGYDLEIHDADGRVTFHGYLNENTLDRLYAPGAQNGFVALLGLGIVAALAYVADDPEADAWIEGDLLAERGLHLLARDHMIFVDVGVDANFSNYNMAFQGGWMASRYLCDAEARAVVADALDRALYEVPGHDRQPSEQRQSFYDFVFAAATSGATAWSAGAEPGERARIALEHGVDTLAEFPDAPYWQTARFNCDESEAASGTCIAEDGTELELLGYVGRGEKLVSRQPVPMRLRQGSNYHWRTNPYEVNGDGDGSLLLPSVDFRLAYWMARRVR